MNEFGPHWMIMWPFDPKTTGLPTTHNETGAFLCGWVRLTHICTSWDVHNAEAA